MQRHSHAGPAKRRMPVAAFCVCCLFMLTACAGLNVSGTSQTEQTPQGHRGQSTTAGQKKQTSTGEFASLHKPSSPVPIYSGLSGQHPPEAEAAFAQARLLWKRSPTASAMGERCSDPEKALSLLSKAISLDPRYAEAYLRRGLAKSELGEGEEAFEDVTAGIRLQPTAQGYAYRGLVSLRSGQKNAAEKDLRHSLKLDPKQHLAHNYLGTLALSENNQAKACASFKEGCAQGDCSFLETSKKEGICP